MIWISTKQAAEILCLTMRAIQISAAQGKYFSRYVPGVGRGGRQLEIQLESLPPFAQERYFGQISYNVDQTVQEMLELTESQQKAVFEKMRVVKSYEAFKEKYPGADKLNAFLILYNSTCRDDPLTRSQLQHMIKKYSVDGLSGLIDRRGTWNKGISTIPDKVAKTFLSYWLTAKGTLDGGPSIASCYRLTQMNFPDLQLPSLPTFERLTKNLPDAAKAYYRKGKKAYQDRYSPYNVRDYEKMHTNQFWTADNHLFDVMVRFPDGHVGRPWVVGFEDMASRYLVGFHIIEGDPNADHILDTFIGAVDNYGLPETVQTDNGRDYCVDDIYATDNIRSLASDMALSVTRAIKYNAKSKPIERVFGTIERNYCIHLPSYIGSDPKRRPENMKKTNDKLKDSVISFDEFRSFMEWAVNEYNNAPHSGEGMNNRTPHQAFEENITVPLKIVNKALLSIYATRQTQLLTVGRNGIRIPRLGQYYDDNCLFPYIGKKIFAKYRTTDVRTVYCFTEEGRYIGMASSLELAEMSKELSAQQIRQLNSRKKARMKMIREYRPDMQVPGIQQLAIEAGHKFNRPNLKLLPSAMVLDAKNQQQAESIREEEQKKTKIKPGAGRKAAGSEIDSAAIDKALQEYFKVE